MKIVFESSNKKYGFPFRVIGNAGRYDTLSDCDFLNDNIIVCGDRQMAKLYLIEFDYEKDTYNVLDSIDAVVNSKPIHSELIHILGNKVYSISYTSELFSCEIIENKFHSLNLININPGDAYHGLISDGNESLYLTNMIKNTILHYNLRNGSKKIIQCSCGVRMKDAAIIDNKYMLVISSDKGPINGTFTKDGKVSPQGNFYDSHILIMDRINGTCLRRYTLEKTQIDGCFFYKNYAFVTCTRYDGTGYLWRAFLTSDYNFIEIHEINCAGFPHGISIHNDILAYTSYSDSALYIHKLDADCNLL